MDAIAFKRLSADAVLPVRAHRTDAGLDLRAAEACTVEPGTRVVVGTGWAIAVPAGWVGLVAPRSGLALNDGVTVANAPGIIDAGYRGELKAILVNHGDTPFAVAVGDRIAQLVVVEAATPVATEVDELPDSDGRGAGGFGSTGR